MAQASISKRTVDAAAAGPKDSFLWDSELRGFGLKVTPSGSKIYIYQYRIARPGEAERTTMKRFTIGKHGNLTPDQARKRARELAVMVEQGIDPRQHELDTFAAADEARRQADEQSRRDTDLAFENVVTQWLAEYEIGRRPRSYEQARLVINKHLMPRLRGIPLPDITRPTIQSIIDGIPARQQALRRTVYAYASIFFGWALRHGDIAENPLANMAKPKAVKPRDRVLSDDELKSIWKAAGALRQPLGAFYRTLLLTGQRREEVAGMDWSELDRSTATWIIPAGRTKNGVANIVPLSALVLDEIDQLSLAAQVKAEAQQPDAQCWPKSGPVITIRGHTALSSFSKAKIALDAELAKLSEDAPAPSPWRVHDLRRTLATGLQRLGVRFEVTEAVLNHVSGAKGGVAGIYQKHDWKEEKRAALNAWAKHVADLLEPDEQGNVVSIDTAKKLPG